MTDSRRTEALRARAETLGFSLFGVAAAEPSEHGDFYVSWLDRSLHGEMAYLARPDAVERRRDPQRSLAMVRSIIVVGHEYGPGPDGISNSDPDRAVIARYARGRDYHDVVLEGLERLGSMLPEVLGAEVRWKAYVDTGPVLERDVARRAGLGWFGRNTMLIDPERGSWFVLGVLLIDHEVEPTPPFEEDRCGSCHACLDACPTGALLGRDAAGAPVIDARRCISYLTIEAKGAIAAELRPLIGNRVFGCDICQEVCPWNGRFGRQREGAAEYRARRGLDSTTLVDFAERLLPMSEKAYQREYHDSPLARPRRRGMLRNLCIGIGNLLEASGSDHDPTREPRPDSSEERAVEVLTRALDDAQPLVRGAAAWALGRATSPEARDALEERLAVEESPEVRREIRDATGA